MANAAALIAKIDKLLIRFNPVVGQVYKRVVTRTGGDPITGRGSATAVVDTPFTVPPTIRSYVFGNLALKGGQLGNSVVLDNGASESIVDYIMNVSPTDITALELTNPHLTIVIDRGTHKEEFTIEGSDPVMIYGTDVMFDLLIRSKKRA